MVASYKSQDTFTASPALLVGADDVITRSITLISGQNLKRGALLGKITTGGKYNLSLSAAADGSQTPNAILAEDCDASGGDKVTIAYFAGTFDENAVTYGTEHTAASVREGLRGKNINLQSSLT